MTAGPALALALPMAVLLITGAWLWDRRGKP